MHNKHSKAEYWKCALQVNPFSYIAYRGGDHGMTEEAYNSKLLEVALENGIKVIGLADHGDVDGIDTIRTLMNNNGILVFPGFEIATTEKVHFVCLFSEDTTAKQLERYLGTLGLVDKPNNVWPSNLGGHELLAKVNELGGFAYAAHSTDEHGILYQKIVHVWKDPLLLAAQIPGRLDDLKNDEGNSYRQILLNKDPNYKRDHPLAIINAKDVAHPEDLANSKASCLIKMTNPCFDSFKLAFQDYKSRVRLNSDASKKYYSHIEHLKITGGYLDEVKIDFSKHLNTVIGGRGTGKSTLLECIRHALSLRPIGENALRQHDQIIKENLGKSNARVELRIRSSKMNGKRFIVARRYGESTVVMDENGHPSMFTPADILPEIEIYGQNEILEIAQDASCQRRLVARFLGVSQKDCEVRIQEALRELSQNRTKLLEAQTKVASLEDEIARLPKLEEQIEQFKDLGLEDRLKIIPLLEKEKRLLKRAIDEEAPNLDQAFQAIKDSLPETVFLNDKTLENLPHADALQQIRNALDNLHEEANKQIIQWENLYSKAKTNLDSLARDIHDGIRQEEDALEKLFKDIPACEGKTGSQIGVEFQTLTKEIEKIRPQKILIETHEKRVKELERLRKSILIELSECRSERSAQFFRSFKKLNKRLAGKLRLKVKPESDRTPVIQFLLDCKLNNIGEARLAWIRDADQFSPIRLAELVREGAEPLRNAEWGITPSVADALARMTPEQILKLEEIDLPDEVCIELNTAHEGEENFRPLEKLSTGQQCTAILHLLLLKNIDPLIMDQPEDNLDNSFIAERIVEELRSAKLARQFVFATHNANIPVFGDAEWIGVFEASEGQAHMPADLQGAIDVPKIRDKAAIILEGGRAAFNQRKNKYGF